MLLTVKMSMCGRIRAVRKYLEVSNRTVCAPRRTSTKPEKVDACHGPKLVATSRADRLKSCYLRAAQAYMLISMPTGTSTIFGAFQAIRVSQVT
jgi:hypothetical protein